MNKSAFILLVVFSALFVLNACEQLSSQEKKYRAGMSWIVRNSTAPMYEKYEVTKVTEETVSWRVTVLNKDRKPFGGTVGNEFTFPIISVKDLLKGEEETLNVAGKSFPCRKIVSEGGTAWRSLEYPLITFKQEVQGMEKEIVEFNP